VGSYCLAKNTTGVGNTAIGYLSGAADNNLISNFLNRDSRIDNYMTFIGAYASRGYEIPTTTAMINGTAIGYNSTVGCSNCLTLGGTSTNAVYVGIGTSTPDSYLTIYGSTTNNLLRVATSTNSSIFTINNNGNISASNNLTVSGTTTLATTSVSTLSIDNLGRLQFEGFSPTGVPAIYADADTDSGIHFDGPDILSLHTGGSDRILINSSGYVGINTSSPAHTLDVNGTFNVNGLASVGSLQGYNDTNQVPLLNDAGFKALLELGNLDEADRTYEFPDAGGTLALTSDLPDMSLYVPYTGATESLDLGVYGLNAGPATTSLPFVADNGSSGLTITESSLFGGLLTVPRMTFRGPIAGNIGAIDAGLYLVANDLHPNPVLYFISESTLGQASISYDPSADTLAIDKKLTMGASITSNSSNSYDLGDINTYWANGYIYYLWASGVYADIITGTTDPSVTIDMYNAELKYAGVTMLDWYNLNGGVTISATTTIGNYDLTVGGNVGIGTTTPSAKLDVYSASSTDGVIISVYNEVQQLFKVFNSVVNGIIAYFGDDTNHTEFEADGTIAFGGTAGIKLPHLLQMSTTTQPILSASDVQPVIFDTDVHHSMITVVSTSQFQIQKEGSYLIALSAIGDTSIAGQHMEMWLRKNGADVEESNTRIQLTQNTEHTLAVTYIEHFEANDTFEVWTWGESTNCRWLATASSTSPNRPATPSVIMTVSYTGKD
jgi:hypothetical protein